jgi:hypothetical protein
VPVENPVKLEVPDDEEEDWFGEGSAFDSGEELAEALFAMASAVREHSPLTAVAPSASLVPEPIQAPEIPPREAAFEVVEPPAPGGDDGRAPVGVAPRATPSPRTWSVRAPGVDPLPPRHHGRSGWTIRNSVQLLRRTESVMQQLREEAVLTAFAAAARALSPEG